MEAAPGDGEAPAEPFIGPLPTRARGAGNRDVITDAEHRRQVLLIEAERARRAALVRSAKASKAGRATAKAKAKAAARQAAVSAAQAGAVEVGEQKKQSMSS